MSRYKLQITDDFHKDVPTDPNNKHFCDLLYTMGLFQHVKQPSHLHGHILDLIITRQSDDFVDEEPLSERFISEHAAVICSFWTRRPVAELKHAKYRKLKSIDSELFAEDICNFCCVYTSPWRLIHKLVNWCNTTLPPVLNKHVPRQLRKLRNRSRPPWFDDEIMQSRGNRRKAEKQWSRSGLSSDLLAFKSKRK